MVSKHAPPTHRAREAKASKRLIWAASLLQRGNQVLKTGRALRSPHYRCDEPGSAEAVPIRVDVHHVGAKPGRDGDDGGVAAVEQLLHVVKRLSHR